MSDVFVVVYDTYDRDGCSNNACHRRLLDIHTDALVPSRVRIFVERFLLVMCYFASGLAYVAMDP